MNERELCSKCDGHGQWIDDQGYLIECDWCGGTGIEVDENDDVAAAQTAYEVYTSSINEEPVDFDNLPIEVRRAWVAAAISLRNFYAPFEVIIPPYDAAPPAAPDAEGDA